MAAIHPDDPLMSIGQHTLLFRARRGLSVALAVADVFARGCDLEALQAKNARAPLEGDEATAFKKLLSASAYVSAFSFASYLLQLIDGEGEPPNDIPEPDFLFDTRAGCAEIAGRRPRPGDRRRQGRRRSDDAGARLRARRDGRAAQPQGPLRRHRPFRGSAHQDRPRRLHHRRFRRRAGQEVEAAGDDLQEAGRGRRQPHRQIPVGQARQDGDGL